MRLYRVVFRVEGDGVVVWERTVFLVEAKGGFISLAAKRGDLEAAVADIKASAGEAYYQAARLLLLLEEEGRVE